MPRAFDVEAPARPARPEEPALLPPNRMPKRGRAGSERSRIALLHALAHIEFGAIDLALAMAGRAVGAHYGTLPAHHGLWEAAAETAHGAGARLAVVPMVLEARGLDVTPVTL